MASNSFLNLDVYLAVAFTIFVYLVLFIIWVLWENHRLNSRKTANEYGVVPETPDRSETDSQKCLHEIVSCPRRSWGAYRRMVRSLGIARTCLGCTTLLCIAFGIGMALTAIAFVIVMKYQESLVFGPTDEGDCGSKSCNFEDVNAEAIGIPGTDTTPLLSGFLFEYEGDEFTEDEVLIALYNHGSSYNIGVDYRVKRIEDLVSLGMNIFEYDYPGYGNSGGDVGEDELYNSSEVAMEWLMNRYNTTMDNIIIIGRSLGGAPSCEMVSKGREHKALMLFSTFGSFKDVLRSYFPLMGDLCASLLKYDFENADKASSYNGPFYQSHGSNDDWIDIDIGKQIYDAVDSPDKVWYKHSKGHDTDITDGEMVALAEFLDTLRN
eukprot:Rmarinus@m.12831